MERGVKEAAAGGARREQFKASGLVAAAAARRREALSTVGKDKREAALRAKRVRRSAPGALQLGVGSGAAGRAAVAAGADVAMAGAEAELGAAPHAASGEQVHLGEVGEGEYASAKRAVEGQVCAAVAELRSALGSGGSSSSKGARVLNALRAVRQLLSADDEPPAAAAVDAGCVALLCDCLAFDAAEEQVLEATWCVTNLASGDSETTAAALPAAPLVIAHCSGTPRPALAEQCAWALGNFASDSADVRALLLKQGALPALARMLLRCAGPDDVGMRACRRTVAWAVSSLIKGPSPRAAAELGRMDGVPAAVVTFLSSSDDAEAAVEAAWIVVYLCALSDAAAAALAAAGVAAPLVNLLLYLLREQQQQHEPVLPLQQLMSLSPVVRAIGNFAAGDSQRTELLVQSAEGSALVDGLAACLNPKCHRSLQKDAAWALANIAGGWAAHKEAVWRCGAARSALLVLLRTAAFDVKVEAAFALANLCVGPTVVVRHTTADAGDSSLDERRAEVAVDRLCALADGAGCIEAFLGLIRGADADAARLGLQFAEMVLRHAPNGPERVEAADGIDAIESVQFHENDELRQMSAYLVDTYFGEDYGV